MPAATPASVRKEIAAGTTRPLYLLVGADDIEKDAMAAEFLELVEEGLRAFNVDRLHGGELSVADLVQAAATLPMMAPRRLVIVHDAERFLIPRRESKAAEEEQDRLEAFVRDPPAHASVLFVCGALDQRRRVVKLLLERAAVVDCGSIADATEAERWVRARAARDGVVLDPAAVRVLVDRAGRDLVALRSGLDRVALYALGQKTVTADDVREVVPAGPDEQENFGIANAIQRGDPAGALKELGLALDAGAQPVFVMGQIRIAAERLPAPRLREAIEAVLRTDLALKSTASDQRVLLERLTVELCGPGGAQRPVRRRPS